MIDSVILWTTDATDTVKPLVIVYKFCELYETVKLKGVYININGIGIENLRLAHH